MSDKYLYYCTTCHVAQVDPFAKQPTGSSDDDHSDDLGRYLTDGWCPVCKQVKELRLAEVV